MVSAISVCLVSMGILGNPLRSGMDKWRPFSGVARGLRIGNPWGFATCSLIRQTLDQVIKTYNFDAVAMGASRDVKGIVSLAPYTNGVLPRRLI